MKQLWDFIKDFSYIWILLVVLLVAVSFPNCFDFLQESAFERPPTIIGLTLTLITILLFAKPMNAVYGLMGTSGSISVFFINFIIISILFSCIYYCGFFNTAGISYDINQPHISYGMFADTNSNIIEIRDFIRKPFKDKTVVTEAPGQKETIIIYDCDGLTAKDTIIQQSITTESFYYQNIDYPTVLRSTVMTFLMQEPTDLFAVASTYNAEMSPHTQSNENDKQKTDQFHWILIFQVLIGWIFFGVFISLLYSKFRYES